MSSATTNTLSSLWIRNGPVLRVQGMKSREDKDRTTGKTTIHDLYSSARNTSKGKRKIKYPVLAATRKTLEMSRSRRISPTSSSEINRIKSAPDTSSLYMPIVTQCPEGSSPSRSSYYKESQVNDSTGTVKMCDVNERTYSKQSIDNAGESALSSRPSLSLSTSDLHLSVLRKSAPLTPGEKALKSQKELYERCRLMELEKEKRRAHSRHDPDRLSVRKVMKFLSTPNHANTTQNRRRNRPHTDTALYEKRRERIGSGIACLPELGGPRHGSLLFFGSDSQKTSKANLKVMDLDPPVSQISSSSSSSSSSSTLPGISYGKKATSNQSHHHNTINPTSLSHDYKRRLNAILSTKRSTSVTSSTEKMEVHNSSGEITRHDRSPGQTTATHQTSNKHSSNESPRNKLSVQQLTPPEGDCLLQNKKSQKDACHLINETVDKADRQPSNVSHNFNTHKTELSEDTASINHNWLKKPRYTSNYQLIQNVQTAHELTYTKHDVAESSILPSSHTSHLSLDRRKVVFSDLSESVTVNLASRATEDMATDADYDIRERQNRKAVLNVFIPSS